MKRAHRCAARILFLWLSMGVPAVAQPSSASNLLIQLERVANTGTVLMIGAHPDDENTAVLAYLAQGRRLRAGYLSLTRGEGGQNVIGSEKGMLLGAIRTQELLAARQIDGAEQFFTSAVDFGFSKTAEETLQKWDRNRIVGDIVHVLREFRPDAVITVFSGTPADGHGQHQASAILAREAIEAAKDPARYSEQKLMPWSVARVFQFLRQPRAGEGGLTINTGAYEPLLGVSFTELAAISRSQHRSQAMGAAQNVGAARATVQSASPGTPAAGDFLEGLPIGPARINPQYAALMTKAIGAFDAREPHGMIPVLLQARRVLRTSEGDLAARKLREIDELILRCAGGLLEVAAQAPHGTEGATVQVRVQAINRSPVPMRLDALELPGADPFPPADLAQNTLLRKQIPWKVQVSIPMTRFRLHVAGEPLTVTRPLVYRYVDDVLGDRTQPFAITPPVSVSFADSAVLFRDASPREVAVQVQSFAGAAVAGTVSLQLPAGWDAQPVSQAFRLETDGAAATLRFQITPSKKTGAYQVNAVATIGGARFDSAITIIRYPHIPAQTILQPDNATFTRADVRVLARTVGYIEGAGDDVPAALRQMGCEVGMISADELASGTLDKYDAIVTGVRAFNVRTDVGANLGRLSEYVRKGGTLVVQYNTFEQNMGPLGPFPMKLSRSRVAVEEAPVKILHPESPLLRTPNAITAADFEGWIQERGLYFPGEWDAKLQPVIASNDPGEKELPGGILYGKLGQGTFIYTSYSWFRQLPAGVPGAFRIFANLLSQ